MAQLPQGTVTFLFTDIEGSTRLLKQLGKEYEGVLADQQRILRAAAEAHDGREVDNQGDSHFFAFARANAALAAAVDAQRALSKHSWPEGCDVRVRMGLHTGEPAVGDERYVGLGVHRAARIGAVAHGGQVVLSSATRELVEDEVGDVSLRDLGTYRLKDIDRPERLFQLDIGGLQTDFPPLNAEKVAAPRPLRRRAILLAALAGVIAAAAAIPIFALGGGGGGESVQAVGGDSVGVYDGSGRLVADAPVGASPTKIAVGAGAIWVTNTDDDTVSKVDLATNRPVDTIQVGHGPVGVAVCDGFVWVANSLDGTVSWIDPKVDREVQRINVGSGPLGVACANGSVWVANTGDGTITKIDSSSGEKETLQIPATELVFGADSLWASQRDGNQVVRIDPATGKVEQAIHVGNGPTGIAFGNGAVWVANSLDGTVTRINPENNAVAATISAGDGPTAVAVDQGGVWVSNEFSGTLTKIDPLTNLPGKPVHVGERPQGLASSGENLLLAVRQPGAAHRGGTLVLREQGGQAKAVDSIDTSKAYQPASWAILRVTGDGLVGYNQVSGVAGTQLVPDLAVSLPAPTDGGRTYTFTLRHRIRYSDGRPVKASDFRATIERDFKAGAPVSYFDGIVGGAACRKRPQRCDLSRGIVVNDADRTVTFHLAAADPEFLYKLALPFAFVVPRGTPPRDVGTHPLPATGPYAIATYEPERLIKLVRNRYFHEWSQAAQPDGYPDEIVVRVGGSTDRAIADVTSGKADALFLTVPLSARQLAALATRHASQLHTDPYPAVNGLFLNTRVAPFDRLDVRRALNYAVDRTAGVQTYGGPYAARPTCQTLPPDFPGYRPYCPYTAAPSSKGTWTAPDLARARALVARSGTRGMNVTVWSWSAAPGIGPLAARTLRELGYRVSVKPEGDDYFDDIQDSRNKAQIGFWGWGADYPSPSGFFNPTFTCASFAPGSASQNQNSSEFCDPRIDRLIARATEAQGTNPNTARQLWARVDRSVADQSPWVPLYSANTVNLLSRRVGNYQYSPAGFGMFLDQLWVR